jgi:acyl-CoA synthetase (AMP-forming)/AMP-acid ligase II
MKDVGNQAEAVVNLAEMISHQARRRPGHPAIIAGDDVISHGELDPLVRGAAAWLVDRGVRPGDVVGLALADTADHLILHYAVARMGGIILPIDWRWTAGEKRRIAEFFGATLVLAQTAEGVASEVVIDGSWREQVGAADADRDFPADGDAPVVLSLSSGTTGRPKGPALSHRQFLARWITQFVTLTFSEHDRYLNAIPLYFGGGRSFSMSALYAGATVILYPPPYEPGALIEVAARHGATTTLLVPTLLRRLLAVAGPDSLAFPSLRLLLSTGAILHPDERADVMARLCPGFINYYGSTEGGGVSVLMPHHPADKASSVGATVFGVDLEIVDQDHTPVTAGEIGRIRYRGPGIPEGFFRDTEASKASFRDGWFYPGDLGRLDADGFLHLAGRADDVIIRGGVNVYPAEIEETLLAHPMVRDAVVLGIPSAELGADIAAFVVAAPEAGAAALIAHCRDRLAPYKVPRSIDIIDELPKTALGKVIKSDLVARLGLD